MSLFKLTQLRAELNEYSLAGPSSSTHAVLVSFFSLFIVKSKLISHLILKAWVSALFCQLFVCFAFFCAANQSASGEKSQNFSEVLVSSLTVSPSKAAQNNE